MSLLPFLSIAFLFGVLSLATRSRPSLSGWIGSVGLLLALVTATMIRRDEPVFVGEVSMTGDAWIGTFLVIGSATSLLLVLLAATHTWTPSLPGATLVALGGVAVALTVDAPAVAVTVAAASAVAGLLVTVSPEAADRGVPVAASELRALVVAAALGLVGVAISSGPVAAGLAEPALLGPAWLLVAAAAAIRLGAIPFHLWTARVADAAPTLGLPLVLAWLPAAFAAVAIGWTATGAVSGEPGIGAEQGLIVVAAALTIVLGTVAALVHDDLAHVAGYSIVADAGVALLGLATRDPAAASAGLAWLVVFATAKTALAAGVAGIEATYGTRRIRDLDGFARPQPLLALGIGAAVVATVGWPGSAALDARSALVDAALDGPAGALLAVAGFAPLAIGVRLLAIGIRRPSPRVAAGPDPRPTWPGGPSARAADLAALAVTAWSANRAPIAAAVVALLGVVALAVGGGVIDVEVAARDR